jgi:hypothetical protein
MGTTRGKKPEAADRSMQPEKGPSRLFFFPKRVPPVSVRAETQAEAERLLEAANRKEA